MKLKDLPKEILIKIFSISHPDLYEHLDEDEFFNVILWILESNYNSH